MDKTMKVMIKSLIDWIKPKHSHDWETTHTNGFYMPTQQECECGAKRHRVLIFEKPETQNNWEEGPHPKTKSV